MSAQPESILKIDINEDELTHRGLGRTSFTLLHGGVSELAEPEIEVSDLNAEAPRFNILDKLTSKELDAFGLAALGYSNREISNQLDRVIETTRGHINSVCAKLGADDKKTAIQIAIEAGLIERIRVSNEEAKHAKAALQALEEMERQREPEPAKNHLTKGQLEVLEALSKDLTNQQIADLLGKSEATIKFHLKAINRRLGLKNRVEAKRSIIFSEDGELMFAIPLDYNWKEEVMNEDKLNQGDTGPQIAQAKAIEADIEAQLGTEIDATVKAVLGQPGAEGKSVGDLSFPMTNENMLMELVDKNFAPIDAIDTKQIGVNGLVAAIMMTRSNKKSLFFDKDTLPHARNVS